MELYIDRDALKRALSRVQEIIERRSTVPILSHVLLHAREGALHITATDQETAYRGELAANVRTPGELAVDAQALFQIFRELPEQTVQLVRTDKSQLEIRSGRSSFRLLAVGAEDYPALSPFVALATARLAQGDLRRLVDQVSFSVASEDVRWGLNGAHLEERATEDGPRLRMVATDGHRLAASEARFDGQVRFAPRQLVPRKALRVLRKLLEGEAEPVTLAFGEGAIQLELPQETFWFRMLEGEFPDYKAVVPSQGKHTATVRRADLSAALRRVGILVSDRARPVRFRFEDGELEVFNRNIERGEVSETLPVELEGPPISVGFNPRYLQEILSVVQGERLVLELAHPLAPCLVKDPDRDDAFFVVMPMRLD
jgi:DNA polymerase-3 subunit beta